MAMIQDEIGDKGFLRRNEHEIGEPAKIIALEGSNGDKTHLRVLCHGVEHDVPYHQWIPKKSGMYVINSKAVCAIRRLRVSLTAYLLK